MINCASTRITEDEVTSSSVFSIVIGAGSVFME